MKQLFREMDDAVTRKRTKRTSHMRVFHSHTPTASNIYLCGKHSVAVAAYTHTTEGKQIKRPDDFGRMDMEERDVDRAHIERWSHTRA
jgi:hypothetical protein